GRRILRALENFGGVDLRTANILDVGCSAGLITDEIATTVRFAIGVDADVESIERAASRDSGAYFVVASGESLPFRDERFDAVICNHVYEHVADAARMMREIHRVLRMGGACYFAGGHTLQLVEPHYRLPLLSWLPRSVASRWLRSLRRADAYTERFVAPWRLRRMLAPFVDVRFISTQMLRDPERFEFRQFARWPSSVRRITLTAGLLPRLAPTWIYMLRKR
ncbi:MAG TPA: class I SAM-dependent methyltransferase, partial [Casimicrobiaceae bacterium]|nr:class I SAM-dependent methyltransferase [Casimicrobiaceae bacterium]